MIYEIKNSEEAIEFGKNATPEQVASLKVAFTTYQMQYIRIKNGAFSVLDEGVFNALSDITSKKQLCDEALYAHDIKKGANNDK